MFSAVREALGHGLEVGAEKMCSPPLLKAGLPGSEGLGPSAELKTLPPDAGLGKGRGLPSETSGAGTGEVPASKIGPAAGLAGGLAEGRARSFPRSQEDSVVCTPGPGDLFP